ncbi:MAG: MarR family transcriptional regulator [Rhodoferax sp.]|nr:MarR family transcriptional regulator [Rhodoferax sp.]
MHSYTNPILSIPRSINLLGALALATMDKLRNEPVDTLTTRAALLALSKYPGCSIDALRANLGLSHPATVRVVAGLMHSGLLTKTTGTDRRSVALTLSTEGHDAVAQALHQRQQALSQMLQPLSARELRQFEALALKILWHETRDAAHALKICRLCDEADCLAQGCPVECKECGQAQPS